MFKLKISTDNAAFQDENLKAELARILRDVADKLDQDLEYGNCRDVNGNKVGEWAVD